LNYTPQAAQEILFGKTPDSCSPQDVAAAAAARAVPKLSVYVVSTNPEHEQGIEYLFSEIPCRLVRLQATDFFTSQQGLYPGMGVDRAATLKAACAHYGYPALVLDGGTAMTYTAADCQGKIVGGGILPGLRVKLQSLHDYTAALPLVTVSKVLEVAQACEKTKKSLPVFAIDTETAMLSAVLKETAVNLHSVIQAFARQMQPDLAPPGDSDNGNDDSDEEDSLTPQVNRDFNVCLTGGDHPLIHALLRPNKGHMVQADPVNPADLDFKVTSLKHLGTNGIQSMLWENFRKTHGDDIDSFAEEASAAKSAVAPVTKAAVTAAAVVPVPSAPPAPAPSPASTADDPAMKAAARAFALSGVPAKQAVVAGVVPTVVPAKPAVVAEAIPVAAAAPGESTKRVFNAVETHVSLPQAKKPKVVVPAPPKPKVVVPAPPKPKVVVPAPTAPAAPPKLSTTQPEEEEPEEEKEEVAPLTGQNKYLNRRVSKFFGQALYFGVVDEFYNPDGVDLWHVTYDDGDQEDFEWDELMVAFEDYRKNKNKDAEAEA
jgi:pantothenate kinase type III